jgi:pyridoxine 4-dehydrogenase
VAINWCRAKGAVPIVGVKTLQQAKDNLACLSWDLKPAEVSHAWGRWCRKGLGKDA